MTSSFIFKITKCVFGGDGLSELEGKTVFIEGALPGEKVEAQIIEEKKSYSRAKLLRVLEPSPFRIAPPCSYEAHCGGCQYQHVDYAEELRMKESQLREILERAGLSGVPIEPIIGSPNEYGYRSSLTLHPVQPQSKSSTRLGLVAKDNQSIIPIKNCLIADPRFKAVYSLELPAKKCPERVTFKLDESGRMIDDIKESYLRMRLGDESYLVHSGGFFQTHPEIARQILDFVRNEIQSVKPDVLFDLFAGIGTFGLAGASFCQSTVFVEESSLAVHALRMNIAERKLDHAVVFHGRVEKMFQNAWTEHGRKRAMIILDPPRAGLDAGLAQILAKTSAEHMVYVSCDPVTLARDLQVLIRGGLFKLDSIRPFDMFPRTRHMEVAAKIVRI